jgi:RNA polymerase sigma-70 factor (ECF subfamily)
MLDKNVAKAPRKRAVSRTADETRFHNLFDRHQRAVMAYFMRRIPNEADALDATEDVFLVAWRKLDEVPEGDATLCWLYGVARRVLANHRRGWARFARLGRKIAAEPAYPAQDSATAAIRSVQEEQMLRALRTLPEKDREVLRLTYWEQLPHEDIGRILGCPTEAVHVRRYRAVNRLGNALGRTGHERSESTSRVQPEGSHHVD